MFRMQLQAIFNGKLNRIINDELSRLRFFKGIALIAQTLTIHKEIGVNHSKL